MLQVLAALFIALGLVYGIMVRTEAICSLVRCGLPTSIDLNSPEPGAKVCERHPLTGSVKAGVQPVIIVDIGGDNVFVQNAIYPNPPNWSAKWWNVRMIGRDEWGLYVHFGEGRLGIGQHFTVWGYINPINPNNGTPIDPGTLSIKNIHRHPSIHGGRFRLGTFERKDC